MAVSKKTYIWIFVLIAIVAVIAIVYYFFTKDNVPTPSEPVPSGSPTPAWAPESFPLNVGMYGAKIKAMQAVLNIATDGKFGNQTKNAIQAKGYSVPLSQSDYSILISSGGGNASSNIKGAYAKYDNTILRNKDLSQKQVFNKDQWMGTVTGTDASGSYYELDGSYYVIKSSTYLKA